MWDWGVVGSDTTNFRMLQGTLSLMSDYWLAFEIRFSFGLVTLEDFEIYLRFYLWLGSDF